MSAERGDHAARALIEYDAAVQVMEAEGVTDGTIVASALLAQVHATLALVEQQRIANLITVAGWVADSRAEDVGFDLDRLRTGIAGEVWEGLGLS